MLNLPEFKILLKEENAHYYRFTVESNSLPLVCTKCGWIKVDYFAEDRDLHYKVHQVTLGNELIIKSVSLLPCLEDAIDDDKISDITFKIEINDLFDEYQFSDLKVVSTKHKEYENCSFIICRDCFKEIIKEIEGEVIE